MEVGAVVLVTSSRFYGGEFSLLLELTPHIIPPAGVIPASRL